MPRETKAERQLREQAEREAFERAEAEWRKLTLPFLLLKLAARAQALGAEVRLKPVEPTVKEPGGAVTLDFRFEDAADNFTASTTMERWEFDMADNTVSGYEHEKRRREARLQLARETYDTLTTEQREALGLTRRP